MNTWLDASIASSHARAPTSHALVKLQVPQVLVEIVYRLALSAPAFLFGPTKHGPVLTAP
jgi:hypothetical protein